MATEQVLSTHDLRGPAVDYKRFKTQTAKWSRGVKTSDRDSSGSDYAQYAPGFAEGTRRPIQPRPNYGSLRTHRSASRFAKKSGQADKFDHFEEQVSGESDKDSMAGSPGCAPDEGITYSFDAATGPRRGSHVLAVALTDAVERFEGKQTEKLIKDEYEVVGADSPAARPGKNSKSHDLIDADDFELL